jgi:transcription elongation factor Elf1
MKTKKKKIIYNIKPKSYDISYEFICPECGLNHWLTKVESKTKLFKIACDCGLIIVPVRIKNIKLNYEKYDRDHKRVKPEIQNSSNTTDNKNTTDSDPVSNDIILSDEVLNKSAEYLQNYGFEKSEAKDLIKKAFDEIKIDNPVALLKKALQLLGVNNGSFTQAD